MTSRLKGIAFHPVTATLILLIGWLLLALGYWGAWIWSESAALRILGLDFPEYVKFVAEVRSGVIQLTREVFFLPLVTLSLSLSLLAHRAEFRFPRLIRWLLNLAAVPVALSMLPPAWTPELLQTDEFLKQSVLIALCLVAALLSYPLLRRISGWIVALFLSLLAAASIYAPLEALARLQPALDAIFGKPVSVGRGPWQTAIGILLVVLASWLAVIIPGKNSSSPSPSPSHESGPD
ncbi:MAG: hypothetical protein U9R25_19310 [Chloroflexota bacterium]|nr:hypothetical protein [Chloroflexota bacterium]